MICGKTDGCCAATFQPSGVPFGGGESWQAPAAPDWLVAAVAADDGVEPPGCPLQAPSTTSSNVTYTAARDRVMVEA